MRLVTLIALACLPFLALAQALGALPVGYDHPESSLGGPTVPDGLDWIARVWPNTLTFAERPAGGKLTVMFLTNFSGVNTLHELNRRFAMDALQVAPSFANEFPGRDVFYQALRSRPRIDVFVLSRIHPGTIPADVQYEILRRVNDDGAGLVVIDLFDSSDTLNPQFLKLQPTEKGSELIPGIPYEGLRQWETTQETYFASFNYWNTNGVLRSAPAIKPFKYASVEVSPFGKGRVIWVSTGSHWERYWGGRTLLPHIQQDLNMWVEADYLYSHTAKVILKASGRVRDVELVGLTPRGACTGAEAVVVTLACPAGKPFSGTLRWQLRDTWGVVTERGRQPVALPATGGAVSLADVHRYDAGRQFLDVWIDNPAGETVDWGATFVEVNRGVAPPEIRPAHPQGAPRGGPLAGTVRLANPPPGSAVRVSLVDRYWREVGRLQRAASAETPFSFPSSGLEGQIWLVKVDLLDTQGRLLARSHATLTSPHTRGTRDGFHPLMSTSGFATPEEAGRREYLRRIGFLANRPYGGSNALEAEAAAWNDIQAMPFVLNVNGPNDDYQSDRLTDWEDPAVRADVDRAYRLVVEQLSPFGLRGFNQTDDSAAATQLPLGAYTTIKFHEWLQKEYGSHEGVCAAWHWQPEPETTPPDELPSDPYVAVRFHEWLKQKHGSLEAVAEAWKMTKSGFGSFHTFGTIQRELLRKQHEAGNDLPWAEATQFMREYRATNPTENPWGRIHPASVKRQQEAGNAAPAIDAQRFLLGRWVENMTWAKQAVAAVRPDLAVGTDAAFYGAAQSDAFGRLDYVAPYYEDRAVKVAVSRGRARRPGDYGACLGAYGDKAADQSSRRSQIWDVLFAGGTGFYYWAFGDGINESYVLSDKHARYQCEVIEEISQGLGELFTGCERIFDPVALLDSETSALCDEVLKKAEPITTQANSIGAFQYAFEDLGLNPHTITSGELVAGWLTEHGTKLLALPGVCSMSDAEISAVRRFVEQGGTVVADTRPGALLPNSNPREGLALDDVFGVQSTAAGPSRRVVGAMSGADGTAFGEVYADPRVTAAAAQSAARVGNTRTLLRNAFGKGKAWLLNASFDAYADLRNEGGAVWEPWSGVMRGVAQDAGLSAGFRGASEGKPTPGLEFSPFRNGPGYLLGVEDLGCGDFVGPRRPFEARLPGSFHVYEMRAGKYLGRTDTLKDDLPRRGHRAYCLLPYEVAGVSAQLDRPTARPGDTVTVSVDPRTNPTGPQCLHVVRVDVTDPRGRPFFPFHRVLRLPPTGPLKIPLTLAYTDPQGNWRLTVTDIDSGKSSNLTLTLAGGGTKP